MRTACSDDFLWLVAATNRYVEVTHDLSVLAEPAGYLVGRALGSGEESYYDLPGISDLREPLYRHCVRAIEHSLRRGEHGLPLIGSGDWNDGMNRVGYLGQGESVWLGFFSCHVLKGFSSVAQQFGDDDSGRIRISHGTGTMFEFNTFSSQSCAMVRRVDCSHRLQASRDLRSGAALP